MAGFDLGGMLRQVLDGAPPFSAGQQRSERDFPDLHPAFDDGVRNAPRQAVGAGVADAFRSDRTAPFPDMVAQLYERSDRNQRAGLLSQLLGSVGGQGGSSAMGGLGGAAGLGGLGALGGMLGGLLGGGSGMGERAGGISPDRISPEMLEQMRPDDVRQLAAQAQQQDPSVMDRLGDFYAEHPTLVKTLGTVALAMVMQRMTNRH